MNARVRVASLFATALLGGAGCLSGDHKPEAAAAPPAMRPPVVAPAPPPPPPAPVAPTGPRPGLAVMYGSDLRGRVSVKEIPRPLPPGVTLTPLAARESTGGLARRATLVDRARLEANAVVQVDAGDFLPLASDPPDPAVGSKGVERGVDLVFTAYRRMGVDAATLGERELAGAVKDPRKLLARAKAAHMSLVLANLADRKGKPVFPADTLIDAGGLSVGILGVSELGAAAGAALAKAGYKLGDAREAARASAQALRARGAKVVLALVHTDGALRACELTDGIFEIDVVVTNQHAEAGVAPSPCAARARPRAVVAGGEAVGRLDVRTAGGAPAAFEDHVATLGKEVPVQLGVDLLTRVATIPMIDTKKMEAAMVRGDKRIKMRDLYESWDYGSTKACGFCHQKQVEQWKTTDHAHAMATLKRKKSERDPACLGCHVMGFLQPGGTRDIVMVEGGFSDVGCEACHGPSAEHVRSIDKKLGTHRAVSPAVCLGCHTPDQNVADFDPVAAMKEILGPGHGMPAASPTDAGAPDRSPAPIH
jgi:hypothetical protein